MGSPQQVDSAWTRGTASTKACCAEVPRNRVLVAPRRDTPFGTCRPACNKLIDPSPRGRSEAGSLCCATHATDHATEAGALHFQRPWSASFPRREGWIGVQFVQATGRWSRTAGAQKSTHWLGSRRDRDPLAPACKIGGRNGAYFFPHVTALAQSRRVRSGQIPPRDL